MTHDASVLGMRKNIHDGNVMRYAFLEKWFYPSLMLFFPLNIKFTKNDPQMYQYRKKKLYG